MRGYPERYIVFDTESRTSRVKGEPSSERLTLRLGCALIVDGRAERGRREWWSDFRTEDEFHDMIDGLTFTTTPIYVFAHNIGFDVRQVNWMWWMGQGRYSLTPPPTMPGAGFYKKPLFIADSPPFIVRMFRPDGQQLLLIDTFQWLSVRLATIGEWLGMPKWERPSEGASDEDWWSYCRRDVEVLRAALEGLWDFLKSRRVEHWAATPAAQTMRLYKGREGKGRIVYEADPERLALDRLGYYGGLTEAFRVGPVKGPLYQLDVSSLYPYVMQKEDYPCEVLECGDYSGESVIPDGFAPWDSTAEVWLDTAEHPFPVRGSDQTCWCVGKVRTILCGPELARAWSLGVVRRVGRWVRHRRADLFSEWCEYWWGVRSEAQRLGRKLDDQVAKILMNALHGKFGQRTGEWKPVGRLGHADRYGSGITCHMTKPGVSYWRVINGEEFRRAPEEEDPKGFVPIAAWTSSYARCYMWDMIHLAGLDHVYHVATDSLIVDGEGLGALQVAGFVADGALGLFRHEGTVDRAVIHAANVVDWGAKKKRPGVKRGSKEIQPDIWEVNKWSGFIDDICHKRWDHVTIETLLIDTSRRYPRRELLDDGSTRPWRIDNWELRPEEQSDAPIGRDRFREV